MYEQNRKGLSLYYQDMLMHNTDFVETLSYYDDIILEKIATKFLLSIFVNERSLINDIQNDNNVQSEGIKKSYKDFNPEHVMGYELVKQKDKFKVVVNRDKPFRVCSTNGINIDDTLYVKNLFHSVTNNILKNSHVPVIPYENVCGMDVVATFADGSKYLYNKKEKALYFKGIPPLSISEMESRNLKGASTEEILNFISQHTAQETILYDSEEDVKNNLLSFEEFVTFTINTISHNNEIDLGDFIIVNKMNRSSQYMLISKSWLKAVAETLIKAKDQAPSIQYIKDKIHEFEAHNGKLTLDKQNLEDMIKSIFAINEPSLLFMVNLIRSRLSKEFEDNKGFKDSTYSKLASLLFFYQENFNNDRLKEGISFPSKSLLFFLSVIEGADLKKHILDNGYLKETVIKNFSKELTEELKKKTHSPFNVSKKTIIATLQKHAIKLSSERQKQLDSSFHFFQHGIVFSCKALEERIILQDDMENAIIFASLGLKVNRAYETLSKPISKFNSLPSEAKLPPDNTFTDKEIHCWKEAGKRLIRITKDHKDYIKALDLFINNKQASEQKKSEPYSFSKGISQIRNSYSHSAVSLVIDEEGKISFLFNDLKGLKTISDAEKKRDNNHTRTAFYKLKCPPLNLFNFFHSDIFEKTPVSTDTFFNKLYLLGDMMRFDNGKKMLTFDENGMTISNNIDGDITYDEYPYKSTKWNEINKIL